MHSQHTGSAVAFDWNIRLFIVNPYTYKLSGHYFNMAYLVQICSQTDPTPLLWKLAELGTFGIFESFQ